MPPQTPGAGLVGLWKDSLSVVHHSWGSLWLQFWYEAVIVLPQVPSDSDTFEHTYGRYCYPRGIPLAFCSL